MSVSRIVAILLLVTRPVPGALFAAAPARADDPSPPHSLGADGQTYPCAADRKPACNESGARCVCLEQRACGGARDEPY